MRKKFTCGLLALVLAAGFVSFGCDSSPKDSDIYDDLIISGIVNGNLIRVTLSTSRTFRSAKPILTPTDGDSYVILRGQTEVSRGSILVEEEKITFIPITINNFKPDDFEGTFDSVNGTLILPVIYFDTGGAQGAIQGFSGTVINNSDGTTHTLLLSAVTFPPEEVGYTGLPVRQVITITNLGDAVVIPAGGITLTGPGAGAFTLENHTLITTIPGNATSSFTIQPNAGLAAGTYTATISLAYGASSPVTRNISFSVHYPTSLVLTPEPIDFGDWIIIPYQPVTRPIIITNDNQNNATTVTDIRLTGANPGSFTLGGNLRPIVAPGGTADFSVAPRAGLAAGIYNATIEVAYGAASPARTTVRLRVYAVANLNVSPSDIIFESLSLGYNDPNPIHVTISNTNATYAASVASITLRKDIEFGEGKIASPSDFILGSNLTGINIPPGIGRSITFTVLPRSGYPVGVYTDTLMWTMELKKR